MSFRLSRTDKTAKLEVIQLTLGLPYMAENAYGGILPCDPIAKAWDTRNKGAMQKTLVKSARRPVNM